MDSQTKDQAASGADTRTHQVRLSLYAEEFFRTLPLPAWVKVGDGCEFTMLAVNHAYTHTYGISDADYFGKQDNLHWSASETKAFQNTRDEAVTTGKPVMVSSVVLNRLTGKNERVSMVKWPLYSQGAVIGVAGIILERITISDKLLKTLILLVPLKLFKFVMSVLKKKGYA